MKPQIKKQVIRHGQLLITLFDLPASTDPVNLCRNLRRLESSYHKLCEEYCNGFIEFGEFEARSTEIEKKVLFILNPLNNTKTGRMIYFNTDPRGMCLKVDSSFTPYEMFRDWGGYGIIAPEFN